MYQGCEPSPISACPTWQRLQTLIYLIQFTLHCLPLLNKQILKQFIWVTQLIVCVPTCNEGFWAHCCSILLSFARQTIQIKKLYSFVNTQLKLSLWNTSFCFTLFLNYSPFKIQGCGILWKRCFEPNTVSTWWTLEEVHLQVCMK